jgi:hypothetical protein
MTEKLFVAESTIESHINKFLAKLGVRVRVQLVIRTASLDLSNQVTQRLGANTYSASGGRTARSIGTVLTYPT